MNLSNLVYTITEYLYSVGEAKLIINGENHIFTINDKGNLFLGYDTFLSLEHSPEEVTECIYNYIKGLSRPKALIKDLEGVKLSLRNGEWKVTSPEGKEYLCYSTEIAMHLLEGMAIPF